MEHQRSANRLETLTPREREVLALVAKGMTNSEIAARLGISFSTVKTHVSEILGRLGVESREEAAAMWHRERKWRMPRPARPSWLAGPLLPVVAGGAVTGLVVMVAVVGLLFAAPPGEEPAREPLVVDLDSLPADVPAKVGIYGQDHLGRQLPIYALRTGESSAIALLGRDPHSGCSVLPWAAIDNGWQRGELQPWPAFDALCSGWKFSATGEVMFGAAARGLDQFLTTVTGQSVEIDLSRVILGTCREGMTPEPGSCSEQGALVVVSKPPAPVIPDWGVED